MSLNDISIKQRDCFKVLIPVSSVPLCAHLRKPRGHHYKDSKLCVQCEMIAQNCRPDLLFQNYRYQINMNFTSKRVTCI